MSSSRICKLLSNLLIIIFCDFFLCYFIKQWCSAILESACLSKYVYMSNLYTYWQRALFSFFFFFISLISSIHWSCGTRHTVGRKHELAPSKVLQERQSRAITRDAHAPKQALHNRSDVEQGHVRPANRFRDEDERDDRVPLGQPLERGGQLDDEASHGKALQTRRTPHSQWQTASSSSSGPWARLTYSTDEPKSPAPKEWLDWFDSRQQTVSKCWFEILSSRTRAPTRGSEFYPPSAPFPVVAGRTGHNLDRKYGTLPRGERLPARNSMDITS